MADLVSRGRFVWYDLMTPDPEGASAFYTEVAGWTLTPWEGGDGEHESEPYLMWTAGDKPIGGQARLPKEAQDQGIPPHWLAYVTVPEMEIVIRRTQELGGSVVMPPQKMEGVGTFAVLQDPQGAVFAPFVPEEGAGGEVEPPEVGHFSWHELLTTDHDAAFQFYSEIFGWKKTDAMDMGEMGLYQMFGPGADVGFSYGGMFNKPTDIPAPPHWIYYIMVPDMDEAVRKVRDLGGQLLNGPREVPGGDKIAQCLDPQGGAFALHSTQGASSGS